MSQLFAVDAVPLVPTLAVVTTTETAIVNSNQIPVPFQTAKAVLQAMVNFTPGTTTTAVTLRIRKGIGIAGTLVGEAYVSGSGLTAAVASNFMVLATDLLAGVGVGQWTLTIQQTAATANGTVNSAVLQSMLLSG